MVTLTVTFVFASVTAVVVVVNPTVLDTVQEFTLQPTFVSWYGRTYHSEFVAVLPAEMFQSASGAVTEVLRTNVWSVVAPLIPATLHPPVPGYPVISVPTASIRYQVPEIFFARPTASSPFQLQKVAL